MYETQNVSDSIEIQSDENNGTINQAENCVKTYRI